MFRDLEAIEIQRTFYQPVPVQVAQRWRAAAPDDFVFCVKACQFITHPATSPTYRRTGSAIPPSEASSYGGFQDSRAVADGWRATLAVAEVLRAEAILFQCPATFGPTEAHVAALYRFFDHIETPALRVWEPRGPWAAHVIARVCDDLGLVRTVDPFAQESATYGLGYFRLHGSPPGPHFYGYTYTDEDLAKLQGLCREYDDAFVLFIIVTMHADAMRFRSRVAAVNG